MSRRYKGKDAKKTKRRSKNKLSSQKSMLSSQKSKILAIAGGALFFYLAFSIFFATHFYGGTVIEGQPVGFRSVKNVKEMMKESLKDYSIQIKTRDYRTETITAEDISLSFVDDGRIEAMKKKQSALGWISTFFVKKNYNGFTVEMDKDRFKEAVDQLTMFDEKYQVEPQSAKTSFDKGTNLMVIMKERAGNIIDKKVFKNALAAAILEREESFSVLKASAYKLPEKTSDDPKLQSKAKEMNRYCSAVITYDFDDRTEVVDGSVISKWLYFDNDGTAHIDEDCVMEYVNELAQEYDTVGTTRTFTSIIGNHIEVSGGTYGWQIDTEDEFYQLLQDIKEGNVVKRAPDYSHIAKSRKKNDVGDTYVEVDLTAQHAYYYKDGKTIVDGPVVTGNTSLGRGTPSGSYYLLGKGRGVYLTGPGYRSYVNYWMPFTTNGIGLHDAPWRGSFGGEIFRYGGSHGCVNMPYSLASTIYESFENTYPVIVHW